MSEQSAPSIEADAVRGQIERILASEPFRRAARMQRFLSFVVEETVAGRSAYLKEYAIAQDVFEKSSDFDPRVCPIVRVEAGRLRRLLARYYADNPADEISVEMPKGTYVPVFCRLVGQSPVSEAVSDGSPLLAYNRVQRPDQVLSVYSAESRPTSYLLCVPDNPVGYSYGVGRSAEALDFLTQFQRHCGSIAARHGGKVVNEAYDGLAVFFGAAFMRDNTAKRALATALDVLSSVEDGALGGGVRIAIASGSMEGSTFPATSVLFEDVQPPSEDETPIIAERALSRTRCNGITIDENTRRFLGETTGLMNAGWLDKVKGERILLWRLSGHGSEQDVSAFFLAADLPAGELADPLLNVEPGVALDQVAGEQSILEGRAALRAVQGLPNTRERWRRELDLLCDLGNLVRTVRGYGDRELQAIYPRSLVLCRKLDSRKELAETLFGQWASAAGHADWSTAEMLAERFAGMSLDEDADGQLSVEAYRLLAANKLYAGDFVAARSHLERCLSLYDASRHGPRFGYDPGATSATYLAWVLWHLGLEEPASRASAEAMRLADEKNHNPTTALVLTYLAFFEIYRGNVDTVLAHTDRLFSLCSKNNYRHWMALGVACSEWAKCQRFRQDSHLDALFSAQAEQERLWGGFFTPGLLILAADMCRLLEKPAEGVRAAATARRFVVAHRERLWEAECDRLIGENLILGRGSNILAAERQFKRAISTATRQSAPSLKQRAIQGLNRIAALQSA